MDDGARVKLIEIADVLARNTPLNAADRKNYLARFRTYYHHLAATVEMSDTPAARGRLEQTAKELEALK